jgi:predicted nucleic acid-binding protein
VYTLDTNAIIYYLNGDRAVMQALEAIIDQGAPRYVSTITVLELFSRRGLTEAEIDDIERILATMFVISLDIDLAREAGDLRSRYGLKTPDSAIAITALRTRSTLLTRNVRDFRRIPALNIQVL